MKRFKGRIVLVTGATSGLGRAAAIEFLREGVKVVVAGRKDNEGEEIVQIYRFIKSLDLVCWPGKIQGM